MPLENLNHFLVAAKDLEATRTFYVDVLGLEEGFRPPFDFRGHWIYLGDRAVVHLADHRDYLDKVDHIRDGSGDSATGPIDHIAFEATGLRTWSRRWKNTASRRATARCRTSACTRSSSTTRTAS